MKMESKMYGNVMNADLQRNYSKYLALGLLDKRSKTPKFKQSIYDKRKKTKVIKPSIQKVINKVEKESKAKLQELPKGVYFNNLKRQLRNTVPTVENFGDDEVATLPINWDTAQNDIKGLFKLLKPTQYSYALSIGDNDRIITLNNNSIATLSDLIEGGVIQDSNGSDGVVNFYHSIASNPEMTLQVRPRNTRPQGGFFPYINIVPDIDLNDFGVYDEVKPKDDNCLINAFKVAGFETTSLYCFVKNQYVPKKDLKKIAENVKVQINLRELTKDLQVNKVIKYNQNKDLPQLELGIIEQHYFLIKEIPYTLYSIQHYNEIKHIPEWNKIYKKTGDNYKRSNQRNTDSLKAIRYMLENKDEYLRTIDGTEVYQLFNFKKMEKKVFDNLEFNEQQATRENKGLSRPQPTSKELPFYFFDFETFTEGKHKPYCVYTDKHPKGFWGDLCGLDLLKDLCETHGVPWSEKSREPHIRLIAHNLQYDWSFINEYLDNHRTLENDGRLLNATVRFCMKRKYVNITFTDSYMMIDMKLSNFGQTFELDQKKELISYTMMNEENYNKRFLSLNKCYDYLINDKIKENYGLAINNEDEIKQTFLNNCKEWSCISNDMVDIRKYAGMYCYLDCIVLKKGWNKFNEMTKEAIDLDTDAYLTQASMANDYFVRNGCYEGVKQLSSVPRAFIQKTLVGGRTMSAENKKQHIKGKLVDFDGVSLYPSAMERIGKVGGFLKGSPKVINIFTPEKYDGYFICIKITKVGKSYRFPLMSVQDEKTKVRTVTNDMVGNIIYVDRFSFEDLIEFHQIEYEFINGYYFDEGRNPTILDKITKLFQTRLKYKKEKNPIQQVFKLIMNSGYGKTILKPNDTKSEYVKSKDLGKFIKRNHNQLKQINKITEKYYKAEVMETIDKHFTTPQVGLEILSMSKRIMNEVMCLAEDNEIDIYYQDTDSTHMKLEDMGKLADKFREKYNRELVGKDMGQFHDDFDFEGHSNIYSEEFICFGKKCYIDKLVGTDDKTGEVHKSHHIRMKGVSESSIWLKAVERSGNITCVEDADIMGLYKAKYEGEMIEFDLSGVKKCFERRVDNSFWTKESFKRMI